MIYKLKLKEKADKELLEKIKREHIEKKEGIYELYDNLIVLGYTESYTKARIYYVAYTLADNGIDFIIN